ncbi:hypothetical protein EDD21DRAFT_378937 [Dissophora ornata]|nr:hypothetical protein EDD21DRAFT_378937 [Dissophora ornata]
MTVNKPEESVEALRKKLATVSLELRNTQLDLMEANDALVSTQDELEDAEAKLEDTEAKLGDAEVKLENMEAMLEETRLRLRHTETARANSEQARQGANRDRVLARPPRQQEVFVVLKFRSPQPLPDGGYRLFTLKRDAVDRTLSQAIAGKLSELDAVEMDELRFDRSPRGEFVYRHMRDDKDAPIEFSRSNFALKAGHTEDEMVEYITKVFNTHTQV